MESDVPDEDIARRVQDGDKDAFGVLVERYEGKLGRYARRFLATKEEREDLLQDVFLRAFANIRSFDTAQKFAPWIYRIAHNAFVNALARSKYRPLLLDNFSADLFFPGLIAPERSDADAIKSEEKIAVDAALGKIDPKYRAPIILYYFDELSYEDIADVLHIPVATVGVRLMRGRAALKKIIKV